ncbi:MAG: hypothetical protein K9H49_03610 [Bacteroidales bacterium]|nr:hypothetical protein [Bacteroidales bacterium]MCF8389377.1 hypothetical protein [Bacteroidales bacterium]
MIRIYLRNIIRFFILIFVQIIIFDNIQLGGNISPYIYVLFIILMPFEIQGWGLLLSAFFLGLGIDILLLSPGFHTAATVLMAFLRPFVLQSFAPRDGYDLGSFPRVYYYGLGWFAKYSIILIFFHHLFLFSLEIFRFSDIFLILWKTVLNTLISGLLIILSQYFVFKK